MKIVKDFSLDNIRKIINQDFPELNIRTIKSTTIGWDNFVVEINSKYIFRFPKNQNNNFKLEKKIIDFISPKITLSIPIIEFIGKSFCYFGYKKIPGKSFSKNLLLKLSEKERSIIAFDLAKFLFEFHSNFSVKKAVEMGIEKEDHHSYYNIIKRKLLDKIEDKKLLKFTEETLREYIEIKKAEEDILVLYNDLHENNLAFDPESKKLNGIFDFGDVMIEDLNREFHYLFRLGFSFTMEVIDVYEKLSNKKIAINRVLIYYKIDELSNLVEYIEKPNSLIYRKSFENIQQLMKINIQTI